MESKDYVLVDKSCLSVVRLQRKMCRGKIGGTKGCKMTDKLLCPFCQQELRPLAIGWCCDCGLCADKELWQRLIRTRKALDVAVDALKHYCTDSDNWSCVIDFTGDYDNTPSEFADKAIEQITALEQKEHFADASKTIEQKD